MTEIKNIKDVLPERKELFPDVDKVESAALIGKEIVLLEAEELDGEYGKFYVALIEVDGEKKSTAFGSKVLNERISQIKDKLPVRCKVVEKKSKKEGRIYYDFE